jgi:cobalt-zinc-cadmium efflux system protein
MPDTQEKQFSKQDIPHRVNRIKIVLLLSSSYLAAAILIVLLTGSLALLSEAGHMTADVGGLALALFAINYTRRPAKNIRFLQAGDTSIAC